MNIGKPLPIKEADVKLALNGLSRTVQILVSQLNGTYDGTNTTGPIPPSGVIGPELFDPTLNLNMSNNGKSVLMDKLTLIRSISETFKSDLLTTQLTLTLLKVSCLI